MAPLLSINDGDERWKMESTTTTSWWLMFLAIGVSVFCSMILVVLMCCGDGNEIKSDRDDDGIHVRTVWWSPYFCEECARRYCDQMYPSEPNEFTSDWWFQNRNDSIVERANDYHVRLHIFDHGEDPVDDRYIEKVLSSSSKKRGSKNDGYQMMLAKERKKKKKPAKSRSKSRDRQRRSRHSQQNSRPTSRSRRRSNDITAKQSGSEISSAVVVGAGGARGGGGGSSGSPGGANNVQQQQEPTEFQSGRNPAAGTLFNAKSNVFEAHGGKGRGPAATPPMDSPGDKEMEAAQANPAYKTIYHAKSGVFDRPGGGGAPAARPAHKSIGGPGPNDQQMAEAASNPAYKTLFGAKSGVFDQQRPGGGGGGGRAVPVVNQSNYRP